MASSSEAQDLVKLGGQFAECENYFEACKQYEKAIESSPADVRTLTKLAHAYSRRRKYVEAADTCLKIFKLDFRRMYISLNVVWAKAFRKLKENDRNVRLMEFEALAVNEAEKALAYVRWGDALQRYPDPDYEAAAEKYKRAVSSDRQRVKAYTGWGNCLLQLKQPEHASEKFREAILLKPFHAPAHAGLGFILLDQGKLAEAVGR